MNKKPLLVDDYEIEAKKDYIVVTNLDVDQNEFIEILKKHDIDINVDYDGLKRHYHVSFLEEKYDSLLAEKDVLIIEDANRLVLLMESQLVEVDSSGYGGNWGLTRICRRSDWNDSTWYPNSGNYTYFRDGDGVDAYVVDTGCRISHSDFGGRATILFDYYLNPDNASYGLDKQGHGTHVASTIGGAKYGVAKKINLLISRVFETGGATLTAIVAGINACTVHHKNKKLNGIQRPSIMNLSLGGPANVTEEKAINDCINEGIIICAAAGNDGKDLDEVGYDVMPAETERAITVGSCDIRDRISSFSNYGYMIDVFAPGHYICAAGIESDSDENMISGTSMATPHVVGVCALYIQDKGMTNNAADVRDVHDWIKINATSGTLNISSTVLDAGSPNNLLYSDYVAEDIIPVVEISRDTVNNVDEVVTQSDPTIETTHYDETVSTTNDDGSITVVTTRYYTETTTITVTTTTTTTPITTITYSDGSTEIITGDSVVTVSTTNMTNTNEYTEIIDETTTPAPEPDPVTEVKRETVDNISTIETRSESTVSSTTFEDVTETVTNEDGSITTTVTRHYTDTIVVTVTTVATNFPITTITYSDGTTSVIIEESYIISTNITEDISTIERIEVISEETTPAPTPEPEPIPEPKPKPKKGKKEKGWRDRGKWSRVRNLKRRIDRLEKMLTKDHDPSILDSIEEMADAFVDAGKYDKVKVFGDFMDEYHRIKELLKK